MEPRWEHDPPSTRERASSRPGRATRGDGAEPGGGQGPHPRRQVPVPAKSRTPHAASPPPLRLETGQGEGLPATLAGLRLGPIALTRCARLFSWRHLLPRSHCCRRKVAVRASHAGLLDYTLLLVGSTGAGLPSWPTLARLEALPSRAGTGPPFLLRSVPAGLTSQHRFHMIQAFSPQGRSQCTPR